MVRSVSQEESNRSDPGQPSDPGGQGKARRVILVVEDDPDVGSWLTIDLRRAGYDVILVDSALAATDRLAPGRDFACDCVVADYKLRKGGQSGVQLLDWCMRHRPDVGRVIFTAAYDDAVFFSRRRHHVAEKAHEQWRLYDKISRAIAGEPPRE